jgi:hypothetical protein
VDLDGLISGGDDIGMGNPKLGQNGGKEEAVKAPMVPQMSNRRSHTLAVDEDCKATAARRLLAILIRHSETTVKDHRRKGVRRDIVCQCGNKAAVRVCRSGVASKT